MDRWAVEYLCTYLLAIGITYYIWSVSPVHRFVYSRTDLVRLSPFYLDLCVLNRPRNWKYRGKRAGKLSKAKEANGTMSIPSIVRSRTLVNSRSSKNNRRSVNLANLIPVESNTTANKHREKDFNVKSSYFGLLNCLCATRLLF